jgi:hypothetical protein
MSVPQHITYWRFCSSRNNKTKSMIQTKTKLNAAAGVLMGGLATAEKIQG